MKKSNNVKDKIITCSWKLFSEKGFEETTLNDIIEAAHIHKGTFYYYFRSKNNLLNTLSVLLDNEYERLEEELDDSMNAFDKLMYLNYNVHKYIGEEIDYKLIANQYASHLIDSEGSTLLDRNRVYYKLISEIIISGQHRGELITTMSASDLVNVYSMCERALLTEWCMSHGTIDLGEFSKEYMPMLFSAYRA